jgi:hypothetical protein
MANLLPQYKGAMILFLVVRGGGREQTTLPQYFAHFGQNKALYVPLGYNTM